MNEVQPIKERRAILAIKKNLKARSARDYLLFVLGLNFYLRVSDLLRLRVADILQPDYVTVKEGKTGKTRRIKLNDASKEAIEFYLQKEKVHNPDHFLFTSTRGNQVISRVRVHQLIKEWTKEVGLKGEYSCHSLRKSYGYALRKAGVDVGTICKMFNHSSVRQTLRYIGIEEEDIFELQDKVNL